MRVISYSELDNVVYDILLATKKTHPLEWEYLNTMYNNGLRVTEVTDVSNIDIVDNQFLLFPPLKRSNPRSIPIQNFSEKYISFVTGDYPLYYHSYPKSLTRLMQNVKLSKNYFIGNKLVSTHLFRHRYIKYLYEILGYDLYQIQNLIAHKSANTTNRYITSKILTY
jgi:site-specific recombinase XerD